MAQSITWIQEFLTKVESKRSPITYVASNDARRYTELLQLLSYEEKDKDGKKTGKRYSDSIYIYDGWNTVSEWDMEHEKSVKVKIPDTVDTLEFLYSKLKYELPAEDKPQTKGTSVIVKNFDKDFFLRFFVFVSTDYKLFRRHSHIIVMVDDVSQVPPELIERVNVIDVLTLPQEREKVVADQLTKTRNKGDVTRIARALSGLNLDQTEAALVGCITKFNGIDMGYLQQQKREIIARRGNLTLLDSSRGFESIGGYSYIKSFLHDFVVLPMRNPKDAAKMGVELPKGILVFGIEGTGKTILAKALGKELDMPVVQFHTGQYKAKYVGETERLTRSAIKGIQELSPCVVFVDEIEHMGFRPTGDTDSGTSLNQFTMLLSFMSENHGSILIGTTNNIKALDPAFMRAGRLDYYLPMMLPDNDARKEIFNVHSHIVRSVPMGSDVDVDKVVALTAWFNGAELELLVKTASALALRDYLSGSKNTKLEVRMEHITKAFEERKVNTDDRKNRTATHKEVAEGLCPKGIIDAAFKQSVDALKVAGDSVEKEYDR